MGIVRWGRCLEWLTNAIFMRSRRRSTILSPSSQRSIRRQSRSTRNIIWKIKIRTIIASYKFKTNIINFLKAGIVRGILLRILKIMLQSPVTCLQPTRQPRKSPKLSGPKCSTTLTNWEECSDFIKS